MFCSKCGQQLDEDNSFCINCGTRIEKVFPAKSNGLKKERGWQSEYGKLVGGILLLIAVVCIVFVVISLNQGKEKYVGTWVSSECYSVWSTQI